jgi:2-keto-4-pentenoate hydratase/2-oxohepta-3-ene-1,7-dioic acid hydratase in catechol pathway
VELAVIVGKEISCLSQEKAMQNIAGMEII